MDSLNVFLKKKGFEPVPYNFKGTLKSLNKKLIPIAFCYNGMGYFTIISRYKEHPDKYFKLLCDGSNDHERIANNTIIKNLTLKDAISEEELREQIENNLLRG